MEWIYSGANFDTIPKNKFGFIYEITLASGKKYIGKKSFYSFINLPPLKGKKRRRKVIKISNWKKYLGSSKEIPTNDKVVSKKILELANSKYHLSFLEEKYLFEVSACINKNYYNKTIGRRYYDTVDLVQGDYLKFKGATND